MFARFFAALTRPERERRLALAASLAFHVVVIGLLLWLFVPGERREAIVTIEVAIVGADGMDRPADTGQAKSPPAVQGEAHQHKPPPPAASAESTPRATPSAPIALPPAQSASDAVMPAAPTLAPHTAPSTSTQAPESTAAPSPSSGTGTTGGASGATLTGKGETASAGQTGSGEGDHPPRYKLGSGSTPYPPYPMTARRAGYQGRVVVKLDVAADGRATNAEVLESSGHDMLDESAVGTLKGWKLEPALSGGKPVPGSVNVPVRFSLKG